MENKKLLLIGRGGHCKSVLDSLINSKQYKQLGLIDKDLTEEQPVLGVSVVGTDNDLESLFSKGWTDAFVAIGSIGNTTNRRAIFDNLLRLGFTIPYIIDDSAIIGSEVILEAGVFVGKRSVINAGTHIGKGAIINSGAIIEHDCFVGDFVHISPGAILCGGVSIGENTHIGAGSVVRQQLKVGCNSLIGIGSVVVKDLPSHCTAFGNPCKVVKQL